MKPRGAYIEAAAFYQHKLEAKDSKHTQNSAAIKSNNTLEAMKQVGARLCWMSIWHSLGLWSRRDG